MATSTITHQTTPNTPLTIELVVAGGDPAFSAMYTTDDTGEAIIVLDENSAGDVYRITESRPGSPQVTFDIQVGADDADTADIVVTTPQTEGFYGLDPEVTKPTITGARSDGTALASLLTALETLGLLVDDSTAS